MRTIIQDLRYGLRFFLGSPGLTAVAVLTLSLGIAANTTVFSWIDALLLHPYPGSTNSHELAVLESVSSTAPNGANRISYLEYLDFRENLRSISGLAAHREEVFTLGDTGASPQAVWGELVSANYFTLLGIPSIRGRVFTEEEEDRPQPVAIISHRLWRTRYNSDPRTIGKSLRVNQRDLTIIGITTPEFRGTMSGLAFDLWVPLSMGREMGILREADFKDRGSRSVYAIVRLAPGATISQANAEAATLAHARAVEYSETNRGISAAVLPVWKFHSGATDLLLKPLLILMALSVLVLFIACANVANLLLARSVARRKEMGIRLALGADCRRLSRQLLSETALLAAAGACGGILLAFWMADLLPSLIPRINAPVAIGFHPSPRVLAFTALACVLATLLSGAAPALYWLRADVNETLKEGGRGGSQSNRSNYTRNILVVAEVALASVALIGAGLFLRSFQAAREMHPGFERTRVDLARFYLSGTGFTRQELNQFTVRLRQRLAANPAIESVAIANDAPLGSGAGPYTNIEVEGYLSPSGLPDAVNNYRVAPGFFHTLRIPLLEGRDFTDRDDTTAPPVIIVNETFARRYFQGANPVGRKVRCFGKWATIVGMAKDGKYFHIAEAPRPHFFAPFYQQASMLQQLYVYFKITGSPTAFRNSLRREVTAVDPRAVAFDLMSLTAWTEVTLLPQTVAAKLLSALAAFAILLASLGLYSVIAYAVTQRTREIGIRMALGARPPNVLAAIMRWGMSLAAAGLIIGIVVSLVAFRFVASMLLTVSATDLRTFLGAAVLLTVITALASYLPAYRATRVDPMVALRAD